jgi:pterin-4a-carbinolamine dehydratase
MPAALTVPEGWRLVERPPALFRRFAFASYGDTRQYLERLAALSRDTGLYPDLGFGPTHVNVTVLGADGQLPGATEAEFASRAAAFAEPVRS